MLDYLIAGGAVHDGSGADPVAADIGVRDGVIVALGKVDEPARETVDAAGALVTPAWIDIHTHYDGQVTWDSEMYPSASHGVGTIVMGNCGVGFAPVAPGGEQELIELMEGVEDIPGTALHEGMPWGAWETYPQYLDFLAGREYALNISSLVAHGAVREMQLSPNTVTGLSDAGAHVSLIFDAVNPTYQLTFWTRDRERGETLPLSHVIHRATRRNAELFGFADRGLIAPGMRADINVIDYENLKLGELTLTQDLSAGGSRLLQGAQGYAMTMVNGIVTRRHDEDTGARPGRLLRSSG